MSSSDGRESKPSADSTTLSAKRVTPPQVDEPTTAARLASAEPQGAFVGRRAELEALYNTVREAATTARLTVAGVTGAPGIGKSRLVDELISLITEGGRRLVVRRITLGAGRSLLAELIRARFGLGPEADDNPAAALDQMALSLGPLVTASKLNDALRLLAALMGLGVSSRGVSLPGFEPDIIHRPDFVERATRTALNLLRYDAGASPHLLVVDGWDAPDRDEDRATVLRLFDVVADRAFACLLVARDAASLPSLSKLALRRIPLAPLSEADTARLISTLVGATTAIPATAVAEIAARAQGNPALVRELVRVLLASGRPGRATRREAAALPTDLVGSAQLRFDALEGFERAVLCAGASFGQAFPIAGATSVLRAGADGQSHFVVLGEDPLRLKVEAALGTLLDRGFLRRTTDGALVRLPVAAFETEALHARALEALSPDLRRAQARLAAQWLSGAPPLARAPWLERIAELWRDGENAPHAARAWLDAGDQHRLENDVRRARACYERGLAMCTDDLAALAADLHERLGRLLFDTGHYDAAEQALSDAVYRALVLDDGPRSARAHVLLAQLSQARGHYDRSSEHLAEAERLFDRARDLEGLADVKETRSRLVSQRGDKDAYARAQELLEEVLRMRRQLKDERALAQTLTNLANIRYGFGQLDDAVRLQLEGLAIRERLGDQRGQIVSLMGLGVARYENGERQEARSLWERAVALSEAHGDRTNHALGLMNLAEWHLEHGNPTDAAPLAHDALEIATDLGNQRLQGFVLSLMATVELALGNEGRALERADRALDLGYAIESRQVVGQASLARARALSHALYVAGGDSSGEAGERHRHAADSFQKAINLLEEMGERPLLIRALEAYGTFLVERGVRHKGKKLLDQAEEMRQAMRSTGQRARINPTPKPARRPTATMPVNPADLPQTTMLPAKTPPPPPKRP